MQLSLRTLLDDGAVIYLNGNRVARVRMPTGIPGGNTSASSEVTDAEFSDVLIPTDALVNGTNRLSVEVHEAGVPLGKASDSGGLTLNGLQLEEIGGVGFATNYARQAGATAFAKDLLGNGQYAPTHTIPNLNNGTYGNGSSWIGKWLWGGHPRRHRLGLYVGPARACNATHRLVVSTGQSRTMSHSRAKGARDSDGFVTGAATKHG